MRRAVVIVGLVLYTIPAEAESVRLSHMDDDERIEVTLWMWGCFGYRAKYHLIVQPRADGTGGATVIVRDIKGLWHHGMGTRSLSADQVRALDLGVDQYRAHRGGCISTNLSRIRLKLMAGRDVIAEEMHYGNSCNVHLVDGAIDFEDLVFTREQ